MHNNEDQTKAISFLLKTYYNSSISPSFPVHKTIKQTDFSSYQQDTINT